MKLYVWPVEEELKNLAEEAPDFMQPNAQPYAVCASEYLTSSQCREINNMYADLESYRYGTCGAMSKQIPAPMKGPLAVVEDFVFGLNKIYWQYDLDPEAGAAWQQTYVVGSDYHKHTDTYAGQSRKLTAVVMLTDSSEYEGGQLEIDCWPKSFWAPPAQGSIVVFQAFHLHQVTEITRGHRQTVNMGFWGPPFK